MAKPRSSVHLPCVPRGLSRVEAATYIGVSATTFDALVAAGEMPAPRRPRTCERSLWDVRELDRAFDDLPTANSERQTVGSPYDADPR